MLSFHFPAKKSISCALSTRTFGKTKSSFVGCPQTSSTSHPSTPGKILEKEKHPMLPIYYIVTKEDREAERSVKELVRANFTFSSRLMTKLKQKHLVKLNGETMQWWITPEAGDIITIGTSRGRRADFHRRIFRSRWFMRMLTCWSSTNSLAWSSTRPRASPAHTIANGLMQKMLEDETTRSVSSTAWI